MRKSSANPRGMQVVYIDGEDLPEDLRLALVDRPKNGHVAPDIVKRLQKRTQATNRRKRLIIAGVAAEIKPRLELQPYKRRAWREKILSAAVDWVTRYELRVLLKAPAGSIRGTVDRLWRKGMLLKRRNPEWAGYRFGVGGSKACLFQYKLADAAVKPDSQNAGRGD